jgi:transposase
MLGGGLVKQLYDLHGQGTPIGEIAERLDIAHNTGRKYLRADGVPKPAPRLGRASKLDPFKPYLHQRLSEGVTNCEVLLRELRGQRCAGSITILKDYVQPLRPPRQPVATVRSKLSRASRRGWTLGAFAIRPSTVLITGCGRSS